MKPPIYYRMFGYNLGLLPNSQLAALEHGVTSLEQARSKALELGFPEYADGDLDLWCVAPPQLVENVSITSPTG